MLKFKPIVYDEDTSFVSYKFVGSSDVTEGQICAVASADINTQYITPYSGPMATVSATAIRDAKKYFPIYKEDPDVENVGATISNGDYVIGFFGYEWEIHESATESGHATSFTSVGQLVAIGSNGKYTPDGGTNATKYIVAQCIGTYNGWIRMRAL